MCLLGDCTTMAVNKSQRCAKHGANGLCTVPGCAARSVDSAASTVGVPRLCASGLYHQRSRTWTLRQARWEYTGCVRPSRLHHQSRHQMTLLQTRWWYSKDCVCVWASRLSTKQTHADSASSTVGVHGLFACIPGCTTKEYAHRLCVKYGGVGKITPYHAPDCPTPAIAHGLCYKHGDLGCAQNQTAPPKCESEDGARSTTSCSTTNSTSHCQTPPTASTVRRAGAILSLSTIFN
jgi:hypothetical protein